MVLGRHKELLLWQFYNFNQVPIRINPRNDQAVVFHFLPVGVVEFVTVPVPFTNHRLVVVCGCRNRVRLQLARVSTQTLCSSHVLNVFLVGHQVNDVVFRIRVKFS